MKITHNSLQLNLEKLRMAMFVNIACLAYFSLGNICVAYFSLGGIETLISKCK